MLLLYREGGGRVLDKILTYVAKGLKSHIIYTPKKEMLFQPYKETI
jgi:hypothetical protein